MSRSSSGRGYSEGELSDSPEVVYRKGMAEDDISLSLSEEDQNSDALDIKPPQHQAGYSSREKSRKREKDGRRERAEDHHSRERKSREGRTFREERKEESRKHERRDRQRDPRKEDLRERLERDRRLRKSKERPEREERKVVLDERRQKHSDQRRERRSDKRHSDYDELEAVPQYKERQRGKEERRYKKDIDHYQVISSPESEDYEMAHNDEEVEEDKHQEKSDKEDEESSESSDEGEASSTETSSTADGEGSPPTKSNGRHHSPISEQEDDHHEVKRFKSDESAVQDDEDVVDIKDKEEVTPVPSPVELKEVLPPYLPAIMGCRSVEEFQCLNKIEEGTYGVVYRARDKKTDEIVALKRLKMEREKEGFPITSLREVSTLLKAQHPNIVTVREIVVGSNMDKIFMVMDYVEHDLKSLMETLKAQKQIFLPGEVKCLLQQLLRAVAHLHDNWILHRDLKTSNLLLSHRGVLKVGDFGLAREYGSPLKSYTSVVVTLWYRAPELLLGAKEYSTPIDVWSVGCIFGELVTMEAILQGKAESDQINKIFKELGTPNDSIWPGYSELPFVKKATFTNNPVSNLRKRFASRLSELGLDLLQKFLTYDPQKRITAEDALSHTYLKEHPLPVDPSIFPTWPAKSEGPRKAQSPKPPSGGRAYKQLGDNDDDVVSSNTGFHMGNTNVDRRIGAVGAGFSLRF